MSTSTRLRNTKFYGSHIFRLILGGVATLSLSVTLVGCQVHKFDKTVQQAISEFPLDSPNFETAVVHAEGDASCFYILFSIPLCEDQSIVTIAWNKMRNQAKLEGKSAQLVNVYEDHSLKWNLFYLFYREYYSVTANVIEYK